MALTSYPNITITSTNTMVRNEFNGSILTSTYGSSVSVTVTNDLAAGFTFEIIQTGTGPVWIIAGSGASINSTTGGAVATSTAYARVRLSAVTDGQFVMSGSIA